MRLMMCKVVGFALVDLHFDIGFQVTHLCTNPTLDLRICYIETWMYLSQNWGEPPKKDFQWFPFFKKKQETIERSRKKNLDTRLNTHTLDISIGENFSSFIKTHPTWSGFISTFVHPQISSSVIKV